MKNTLSRVAIVASAIAFLLPFDARIKAAEPSDYWGRVQAAVDQLGAELGAKQTELFTAALVEGGEKAHAGLGVIAFLGQHLERSAWLYGKGVLAEPQNDVYLNNFGLCLHEKALLTPSRGNAAATTYLTLARESFDKALSLKSDIALYHINQGVALLEIWRFTDDIASLEAALGALRKATSLNSKSAAAWAHLAEVLAAKGDMTGAADALERSRALGPFNGALMSSKLRMPQPVMDAFKKNSPPCKVNFRCKANCPKGIIGQINFVTCEMAQSSAQMACEEGKPYAEAFDCSQKVPKFGILLPGLDSGFSILSPWGRLDILVDGAGNVEYRFKPSTSVVGLGVSLEARGSWTPESGFTVAEITPGVSYNLLGGAAATLLNSVKMGPASISMEGDLKSGKVDLKIKAYGGAIFSH